MDSATIALVLAWLGMGCWIACFWWMHRISSRQDAMLRELHEQTLKIARLSKAEHELLREVHPQVEQIQQGVERVAEAVERKS